MDLEISPSIADGADVDSIDSIDFTSTNPEIDFNPICDLRDKVDCVPTTASDQSVVMECTEVGEQSAIQRGQMKPTGWMERQKKAGNLSSEQFNALKHMRNREGVSPKQSPASKASAIIKRQVQSGAEPPRDGSGINSDNIPGGGKHSRKDSTSATAAGGQDAKAATIARIRRTRQARKQQLERNGSELSHATHLEQQQQLTKLKQQRRDGNITTEQFKALKALKTETVIEL